jgi:hypothetical protein
VLLPEPVIKGFTMLAAVPTVIAFLTIGFTTDGAALPANGNAFDTGAVLTGTLAAACCTLGKTLLAT